MNKNLMEKRIHGEADFPISFYEQSFAADEEVLAPLHYHAEMEVLVAKKGKITVRFDGNEMELEEGFLLTVPGSMPFMEKKERKKHLRRLFFPIS